MGLGILAAALRRESSRGWLLAAAGADAADLVLTLTHAYPFGRRTELVTLASIALYVMLELYLALDQETRGLLNCRIKPVSVMPPFCVAPRM